MCSQGRYLTTREPPWGQNGLPWEHSVENQFGEGTAETKSLILQKGGRDRDRKPNFVACST